MESTPQMILYGNLQLGYKGRKKMLNGVSIQDTKNS